MLSPRYLACSSVSSVRWASKVGRCRLATYSSETDHTRPSISIHASCLAVLSSLKKRKCQSLSCTWLFATPWTVAHQAPLSRGFSRQEHWSGLSFPSPGDLPNPGIKFGPPALQADSLPSEPENVPRHLLILGAQLLLTGPQF